MKLTIICAAACLQSLVARPDLTTEQAETFKLIDQFDKVDTSGLPFVKVVSRLSNELDPVPSETTKYGFLVGEGTASPIIHFLDLTKSPVIQSQRKMLSHTEIEFEVINFVSFVQDFAHRLAGEKNERTPFDYYMTPNAPMTPRCEALVLARACARRQLIAEVNLVWEGIGSISSAVEEFSTGMYNVLCMDFADSNYTRRDLLQLHELWLHSFGGMPKQERIASQARILTRMIDEDARRRDDLSVWKAGRVVSNCSNLIFRLRDSVFPVEEVCANGWFLAPANGPSQNLPASTDLLIQLGLSASSELVDRLGDETLTRCVWYNSRYGGGFSILTVGDLVEAILRKIFGITFYGNVDERNQCWRNWVQQVLKNGEESALANLASRGSITSIPAAAKLLERWPSRVDDVIEGIRRAETFHVRKRLVEAIALVKSDKVTDFLISELRSDQFISCRVAAAQALLGRERKEGLEMFVKIWPQISELRQRQNYDVPESLSTSDNAIIQRSVLRDIVQLLLMSMEPSAVRAVVSSIDTVPAEVRIAILECIESVSEDELLQRVARSDKLNVSMEFETLLLQLLDDAERATGTVTYQSRNGGTVTTYDPRISDRAAYAMVRLWPNRYSFNLDAVTSKRDRQILTIKNVGRRLAGLPLLSMPTELGLRPSPPEVISMLERLQECKEEDRWKEEVSALDTLDLSALPAIQAQIGRLQMDHPAYAPLMKTANRLANVVRKTTLYTQKYDDPARAEVQLQLLEGKVLTSGDLIRAILGVRNVLGVGGQLIISVERLGNGSGISVQMNARSDISEGIGGRFTHFTAMGGGECLGYSTTRGVAADDFGDEKKAIDAALAVPLDKDVEIRIELR